MFVLQVHKVKEQSADAIQDLLKQMAAEVGAARAAQARRGDEVVARYG